MSRNTLSSHPTYSPKDIFPETTLRDWLLPVFETFAPKSALLDLNKPSLTFSELQTLVEAKASQLNQAGLGPNDCVLIALPDGPLALTTFLAVAWTATALPYAALAGEAEYRQLIEEGAVKAIVMEDRSQSVLTKLAEELELPLFKIHQTESDPAGFFDWSVDRPGAPLPAPVVPGPHDLAVVVGTSGTTSVLKLISITHSSLHTTVSQAADWLNLGAGDLSLCMMPFAHLHSLIRSSLPVLCKGGEVLWTPGLDRRQVLQWLDRFRPTYISAVPALFQRLLQCIETEAWVPKGHSLRCLLTGSDTLPEKVAEDLTSTFGNILHQFYGMTEVSPLVVTQSPGKTSAPRKELGHVNDPWKIQIVDGLGKPLPAGTAGQILLKGGFINRALGETSQQQQHLNAAGWFHTGDLGVLNKEGVLTLTGRSSDRIIRGGEKILPTVVEQALRDIDSVKNAAVFALPDPNFGERVAALVVPKEPDKGSPQALLKALATQLPGYMLPEDLWIVKDIPISQVGKVSRSHLADLVTSNQIDQLAVTSLALSSKQQDATKPKIKKQGMAWRKKSSADLIALQAKIESLFQQVLHKEDLPGRSSFYDLGGDSFQAIELLALFEEELDLSLSPALFLQNSSINAIFRLAQKQNQDNAPLSVDRVNSDGTRPPLFLSFNQYGGHGFVPNLSKELGPDQPIYALHLPRRFMGTKGYDSLPQIAEKATKAMIDAQPEGPFYIAGYSFGSHLAFEIAQAVKTAGREVALLAIIEDDADLDKRHFGILSDEGSQRVPPSEKIFLPFRQHVPAPYSGKITLFRAKGSCDFHFESTAADWQYLTDQPVEKHLITGTHATCVEENNLSAWAGLFTQVLQKAQASASTPAAKNKRARKTSAKNSAADLNNRLYQARLAGKEGKLEKEIAHYSKARDLQPVLPEWAERNLAHARAQMLQAEQAFDDYLSNVGQADSSIEAMIFLAGQFQLRNQEQDLEDLSIRCKKLLAKHTAGANKLAEFFTLVGDHEEVVKHSKNAMIESPKYFLSYIWIADSYDALGHPDWAEDYLKRAVEDADLAPQAWLKIAQRASGNGDLDQAVTAFQTAMTLRPEWMDPYLRLSELYLSLAQPREAVNLLSAALRLRPAHPEVRLTLAESYLAQAKHDEAAAQLQKLIEILPPEAATYQGLSQLFLLANENKSKLAGYMPYTYYPHNPDYYRLMIQGFLQAGKQKVAAEIREKAQELFVGLDWPEVAVAQKANS